MQTFRHLAIGQFGYDNGAIDEHADRHNHRKQHDHVDRHAGQVQKE